MDRKAAGLTYIGDRGGKVCAGSEHAMEAALGLEAQGQLLDSLLVLQVQGEELVCQGDTEGLVVAVHHHYLAVQGTGGFYGGPLHESGSQH